MFYLIEITNVYWWNSPTLFYKELSMAYVMKGIIQNFGTLIVLTLVSLQSAQIFRLLLKISVERSTQRVFPYLFLAG